MKLSPFLNLNRFKPDRESLVILVDLVMLGLVIMNLLLLGAEFTFQSKWVQHQLEQHSPDFFVFYRDTIHFNFFLIDMAFVSIFLTELFIRWGFAIYHKTYHRWFFYPFIYWYDVLGCLPGSAFRSLRVLRLFSTLYRLHKMGVIDLSKTYLYQRFIKYRAVITEEISDRVVINVLNGVQSEIEGGTPVFDRVLSEVILPRRELIANWTAEHLSHVVKQSFQTHQPEIRTYLDHLIRRAVRENREVDRLKLVPVLGSRVKQELETAVSDIVYRVLEGAMTDFVNTESPERLQQVANAITDSLLVEIRPEVNTLMTDIIHDSIDIVKEEVKVQQWKIREAAEKAERLKE
ncbi:MAG: ion transporter [Bacteroidota bacterium]